LCFITKLYFVFIFEPQCFHQQYNMIWYLLFSGDPFSTMASLGHTIVYYIFLALDLVSPASVRYTDRRLWYTKTTARYNKSSTRNILSRILQRYKYWCMRYKNEIMSLKSASILFYIKIPRPVLEILHFVRLCYLVYCYSSNLIIWWKDYKHLEIDVLFSVSWVFSLSFFFWILNNQSSHDFWLTVSHALTIRFISNL
jgi:hypothetical protein